jgi:hypothetical protein
MTSMMILNTFPLRDQVILHQENHAGHSLMMKRSVLFYVLEPRQCLIDLLQELNNINIVPHARSLHWLVEEIERGIDTQLRDILIQVKL